MTLLVIDMYFPSVVLPRLFRRRITVSRCLLVLGDLSFD
jgi:hypothetical protein